MNSMKRTTTPSHEDGVDLHRRQAGGQCGVDAVEDLG